MVGTWTQISTVAPQVRSTSLHTKLEVPINRINEFVFPKIWPLDDFQGALEIHDFKILDYV